MNITKLKSALQFAIPEELYDIAPGQIVYFVPKDGLNQGDFRSTLWQFFHVLERIYPGDNKYKVRILPTNNELLIGAFAGRNPEEVGIPYQVIVSTMETIAGFASHYSGVDVETIMDRANNPKGMRKPQPISSKEHPVIISLDPKNRPIGAFSSIDEEYPDDYGLDLLSKRPETQKEKDEKIASQGDKIRKILWECAYLGIDIDVNGIVNEVETIKSQPTSGYQLSLQMKPAKAGTIDCKIFVGEDMELILKQPILKAVYLTFLSLEDGLVIEAATPDFTKRIQKIYKSLPDREEKEIEEDGRQGILHTQYIQPKTLRGHMSDINSAIAKLIPNGLVAIEFSIEGIKNLEFKVMRSTPAIRKQIITAFNL